MFFSVDIPKAFGIKNTRHSWAMPVFLPRFNEKLLFPNAQLIISSLLRIAVFSLWQKISCNPV